jgi:Fe-Mn family superoxide dismutase
LPELKDKPLVELLRDVDNLPNKVQNAIRNHGGGHYNHTNFWLWLSPKNEGEPSGILADDLKEKYGSFQGFMDAFTEKSLGVFGSGWAWLQPDLSIVSTANQDSPLNFGKAEPILGLDVWEHAYYLDYTFKRADYVAAWWHVVNWDEVSKRYTEVQSKLAA